MSIFAPPYDEIFNKNPALITLFPIARDVNDASPYVFVDTTMRLAGIQSKYKIETNGSDYYVSYTIKGISPQDAKKLRSFLTVGDYDIGKDEYTILQKDIPEKVFNTTIEEVTRQLHEDRKSLLPYFSFDNAFIAFTFGLYQFTDLLEEHLQDPAVQVIVKELVMTLGMDERDSNLEKTFKENAVKIFEITDRLIDLAKKIESTDEPKKEILIQAYFQIEEMYLAKLKPLLEVDKKLANAIDRHSNFFMGAGRSSVSEFPANVQRYASLAR